MPPKATLSQLSRANKNHVLSILLGIIKSWLSLHNDALLRRIIVALLLYLGLKKVTIAQATGLCTPQIYNISVPLENSQDQPISDVLAWISTLQS